MRGRLICTAKLLQVLAPHSGLTRDTRHHSWTDFLTIMESEDVVFKASTLQNPM